MATPTDPQATAARHELAAIMFSDIVGYTVMMGRDEESAMRALDAHRGMLRTVLPKFNGHLVGEIGALGGLEKAYEVHSLFLIFLKMDPMFDPLRKEPHFIALMKKLNFGKVT